MLPVPRGTLQEGTLVRLVSRLCLHGVWRHEKGTQDLKAVAICLVPILPIPHSPRRMILKVFNFFLYILGELPVLSDWVVVGSQ